MRLLLCAGVLPMLAYCQQQHSVTLNWEDTQNPAGTTYNVYRASGSCSGSPSFSPIVTGVPVKTYDDNGIAVGNYCYYVTAVVPGQESDPSNNASAYVVNHCNVQIKGVKMRGRVKLMR